MDLTQLDNPAKLLKLMQQFGDDADNADKEIDAVISICLESGLESTILDDFKLLIQISIRDETSDQAENHVTICRRQASNGRQKQVTGRACSHVCFSPLNTAKSSLRLPCSCSGEVRCNLIAEAMFYLPVSNQCEVTGRTSKFLHQICI